MLSFNFFVKKTKQENSRNLYLNYIINYLKTKHIIWYKTFVTNEEKNQQEPHVVVYNFEIKHIHSTYIVTFRIMNIL